MRQSQFATITENFNPGFVRVVVRSSREHKGQRGVVNEHISSDLLVKLDNGAEIRIHYSKVELLDENGVPLIEPCRDMTGREVKIGDVVVYSANDGVGNTSHALIVGRITKLHDTGALTATPLIENGKKSEPPRSITLNTGKTFTISGKKDALIHDPNKCLLLPVDLQLMTVWALTDFEMLAMEGG